MKMMTSRRTRFARRSVSALIIFAFVFTSVLPPAYAQSIASLNLPVPGAMVGPSQTFVPVLLKGMTIHPENPLQFDFIIDSGNTNFRENQIKTESQRLVKYFLASMTIPKDDLWVNLSPYEKDRIIPDELGKTELGRDMLAQDYILKQLTASLMYPEKELGKEFWDKVYRQAKEKYGTTEIPVNTFNKVWILPETATVYEHGQTVYIVDAKLRVMLDSDYEAMQYETKDQRLKTKDLQSNGEKSSVVSLQSSVPSEIIKEIILPAIEKEVNEGQNFAPLRQIYHSLILAKWYKETIKNSLLSKIYIDQKKIAGVNLDDATLKDQIYAQYMEAYKKGVFNYIKEDYDQLSTQPIPRKYFSGGIDRLMNFKTITLNRVTNPSVVESGRVGRNFKLALGITPQKQDAAASPILAEWRTRRHVRILFDANEILVKRKKSFNILTKLDTPDARAIVKLATRLRERIPEGKHYRIENKTVEFLPDARKFQGEGYDFEILYQKENGELKPKEVPGYDPAVGGYWGDGAQGSNSPSSWGPTLYSTNGPIYDGEEWVVDVPEKIEIVRGNMTHNGAEAMIKKKLAQKYPGHPEFANLITDAHKQQVAEIAKDKPKEEVKFDVVYHKEKGNITYHYKAGGLGFYGTTTSEEDWDEIKGDDYEPPKIEIINQSSPSTSPEAGPSDTPKSSSPVVDSLVSLLARRDVPEDQLAQAGIDVLMVPGNDELAVYEKVLDLFSKGIGRYIAISGGRGRLIEDIKRTADANGFSVAMASEAEMIRSIMIQMAQRNPRWAGLVGKLQDDKIVLLEKEARYTVENFTKTETLLKNKGLLGEVKTFKILYIPKTLQQLRTKGQFNSVFAEQIARGKIQGVSFAADHHPQENTPTEIVAEMFRIIANAQKIDPATQRRDWEFEGGLESIPKQNWIDSKTLFDSLPVEQQEKLVAIMQTNARNMGVDDREVLYRGLSPHIKAFAEAVFDYRSSSPITPQEAEAMIKGKLDPQYHHLIRNEHVKQVVQIGSDKFNVVNRSYHRSFEEGVDYETIGNMADYVGGIDGAPPESWIPKIRLLVDTDKYSKGWEGNWDDVAIYEYIEIIPSSSPVIDDGQHVTSWRVWPYGDGKKEELVLGEFTSLQDLAQYQGAALSGAEEQRKEKAKVLKDAIENLKITKIGEKIFGSQSGRELIIRLQRNVFVDEGKRSVSARSQVEDSRLIFTVEESTLGNGSTGDHEGSVLLLASQLLNLGLGYVLKYIQNINDVDEKTMQAFILLKELEFIHYNRNRDKLIKLLESGSVNRIADPMLATIKKYKEKRLKEIVNDVQVPVEEIAIINTHLENLYQDQYIRKDERVAITRMLMALGDFYYENGDYRGAIRQYSHGLFYEPHNERFRAKVVKTVDAFVAAIAEDDAKDFGRIWKEPSSRASEMWDKIKKISLIDELKYLPESLDRSGIVATRFDQVDEAITFLNYLDSVAVAYNPTVEEEDFINYLNEKRLQKDKLKEEPIKRFIATYRSLTKDDSTRKNDSTKKILRLAVILQQYARILHGDESLDAWEIIPKLLVKLGLNDSEREQVMALTSLHRNFGTLYFGEGSPSFTNFSFEQVKDRLSKIEGGKGINKTPVTEVWLSDNETLIRSFINILDSNDVYAGLAKFRFGKDKNNEEIPAGGLFTLMPFMKDLADEKRFMKSPGVSIFDHTMELVKFLTLIEKGDHEAYNAINKNKEGRLIAQEVFNTYHNEFHKWLGEEGTERIKKRRLIYLAAFLHDTGEYELIRGAGEMHEEKSAIFIAQILKQLGLVRQDTEDKSGLLFNEQEVDFIKWLALSHVELGTIRFGERTVGKLFENKFRDPKQGAKERTKWVKALSLVNTADVYGTRNGLNLNQDHFDYFMGILVDDQYLEREFSEGLFGRRMRIWSSDPLGELDRPKFQKVKEVLGKIKSQRPKDYERIVENFGNADRYKVLDYGIFFFQSLRAEDMVKLMYLLSVISDRLGNENKRFDIIKFTAPSNLAPFSADPINEIMKNYTIPRIHDFTKNDSATIMKNLEDHGNLHMGYDPGSSKLIVDNKRLADMNRYIKIAAITAAAWLISKGRSVTTDNHIESLVFLHDLTKLPKYRLLEKNWSKIRLFLGLFGRSRDAINLEQASKLFDGVTLEEMVILLSFISTHYTEMAKTQWGKLTINEFIASIIEIDGGEVMLRTMVPKFDTENVNEKKIVTPKVRNLSNIIGKLMQENAMTNVLREVSGDLSEISSELERIRGVSEKHLKNFEDFLSRINIKNGIWNLRKFSERPTHKLTVFRFLYILSRLEEYYQNVHVKESKKKLIHVLKFSHELDTSSDSEFNVIERIVEGINHLSPQDLEEVFQEEEDPFKKVTKILGLKGRGIEIEESGTLATPDTIFVDLRAEKGDDFAISSSPVAERETSLVESEASNTSRYPSRNMNTEDVGGIDMNAIDLDRQGAGVDIQFDPAELQELIDTGIDGFAPVIINITPLPSVLPLLGLEPQRKEDELEMSSLN
ncbi:MAG: hypothetical protein HZA28_02625 [Candidatus Omnitrophica bacterium]|nr:hypothetical protein [Candidatus Omnitrophota bacterium]